MDISEVKKYLSNNLSKKRYEHCLRVGDEAKRLALYYGENEENAYIAGILHDIAKEYDYDENKKYVDKYNLEYELLDDNNKRVCHGIIGALVAKELYDVNDIVYDAIRYHTVGNINMDNIAKIVFIADKIEKGKNYIGIEEERKMAYKDIDRALILCLENNKKKLNSNKKKFHKDSQMLLDYLLNKRI